VKLVYFYFVFAFRRLSRTRGEAEGWRVLRADLLLLLVETRLAFSAVWLCFPQIMNFGSPLGWGLVIGAPIALATFLLKADNAAYRSYAERFCKMSLFARVLADFTVTIVSIVAVLSPIFVRAILTGRPWWT
jgi:hypothetical protein